jgi:hypothetical protein
MIRDWEGEGEGANPGENLLFFGLFGLFNAGWRDARAFFKFQRATCRISLGSCTFDLNPELRLLELR